MSHRKYHAPRHGSLTFMNKGRCQRYMAKPKAFPKDDPSKPVHLTCFMGYKAGMSHIVRDLDRPGSKMHKKEVVEAVTFIDTPPIVCIGIVGYYETLNGLKPLRTVYADHIGDDAKRRLIVNYGYHRHSAYINNKDKRVFKTDDIQAAIKEINEKCVVVRALCHTQVRKTPLKQKKAHMMEIQVNGGTIQQKTEYCKQLLEKEIPVYDVFAKNEVIDILGITKGKGFQGCTKRFGTKKLPRKSNKGIRKVACIGAWHPARVMYTVARAGQLGYYQRTQVGKKIYMVGKQSELETSGQTEFDLTKKSINPLNGFPHYGLIKNDFIMIKGASMGPKKRVLVLRKPVIHKKKKTKADTEEVTLKFIDTASKIGHGRFQTHQEKKAYFGVTKKEKIRKLREEQE